MYHFFFGGLCVKLLSLFFATRSDVLPVSAGSAAASMALLQKQLTALGMPDWEVFEALSRRKGCSCSKFPINSTAIGFGIQSVNHAVIDSDDIMTYVICI